MKRIFSCLLVALLVVLVFSEETATNDLILKEQQPSKRETAKRANDFSKWILSPKRMQFPSAEGYTGIYTDNPSYAVFGTADTGKSYMFWEEGKRQLFFNYAQIPGSVKSIGIVNSFCDVPSPYNVLEYPSLTAESVTLQIGQAYALYIETSIVYFMISDESMNSNLVITIGQIGRDYWSSYTPCTPEVDYISPIQPWEAGSLLTLTGNFLGRELKQLSINAGKWPCINPTYLVPQTAVRCLIAGTGTNLPLSVKVGSNSNDRELLISFNPNCRLQCDSNSIPDTGCKSCISKTGDTSGTAGPVNLNDMLKSISSNFIKGQYLTDLAFLETAELYKNTAIEQFPIPRYVLPNVDIDIPVSITQIDPLTVIPVTSQIQNINNLATVRLHMAADQARWTRVTTNDTTGAFEWRLDL